MNRFAQLCILSIALFIALLAGWAVAVHRTPLAWFGAVSAWLLTLLWGGFVVAEIRLDIDARRAENDRRWGEAERVWVDLDGDGEVDPGEEFTLNDYRLNEPGTAEVRKQQARALLRWIYERQRLRQGYDQRPGRAAFGRSYDGLMSDLARRGLLTGHTTGHTGKPVFDDADAALVAFDGQDGL